MITPVLPAELDEALSARILEALAEMIAERALGSAKNDGGVK